MSLSDVCRYLYLEAAFTLLFTPAQVYFSQVDIKERVFVIQGHE